MKIPRVNKFALTIMYKRIIKKFRRRYIFSPGIDAIWTSDLIILPKYQIQNDGYIYIFNRYGYVF